MRVLAGALGLVIGLTVVLVLSSVAGASPASSGASPATAKHLGPYYNSTFTETGLPSGTNWSVHVSYVGCGCDGVRTTVYSTTPTIIIPVTNGTYNYNAIKVPGYFVNGSAHGQFNVSGAAVAPIAFHFDPILPYTVTFTETGLPALSLWTVTTTGNGPGQERAAEDQTLSSTGSSLNFTLPNATYHYVVSPVTGSFFVDHSNVGKFVVSGASPPPIAVTFTTPATYALTFTESGLPSGTNWSVRISGFSGVPIHETASSTTSTVSFTLPNGTFHYVIAEVLGFAINGSTTGSATISGAAANVNVPFLQLAQGAFYPVAFGENGLPSGAHWAVTIVATHTFGHSRSETQSGHTSTIFFLLQNGTYRYYAHNVQGYTISAGGTGAFSILGASPSTIVVNYTAIPTYTATFNETGLPSGTAWSLLVRSTNGHSTPWYIHIVGSSNSTTMKFTLPSGGYCYRLYPVSGFKLTSGVYAGSFNVTGAPPATITFGFTAK